MSKRDFLRLSDLTLQEHHRLLARAHSLKARRQKKQLDRTLEGRTLVLIFEKASTRTRLSFEAAMGQLGGQAITLPFDGSQMARGEPLADTARVVSGYADCIMMRTFKDARIQEVARAATVPVINGLTDGAHPVQLLADIMTVQERLGSIEGRTVAFVGDGATNMALSWMEAARIFGFSLRLAAPEGYRPPEAEVKACGSRLLVTASPEEAVAGAEVVVTDVWTSMGQEAETAKRLTAFKGFCVDEALLAKAKPGAMVLHCLPAHRGEEISAGVLDGPQSAAWDEAENRMHAQKALLELLLLG